jgi:hypothetical protein
MNQNVFIYERRPNHQFPKKMKCFSLLYVFVDIEGRFFLLFHGCQKHKTPLQHMRSYSFIQLGIRYCIAFVKIYGSSQYEKFGKVHFLVLKHTNK